MNWLTIKLMEYQLKKAQKGLDKEEYSAVRSARKVMVKTYKSAILFLKASS